jgi:hypothetical protein
MPGEITLPFEAGPSPDREIEDEGPVLSEKDAKRLKQRIKISERYREQEFRSHYDVSMRLYKGKHWDARTAGDPDGESRVIVNLVKPIVQRKVAAIGFRHPEFNLTPLTLESSGRARLATSAMRYEWKVSKTQREAVRALHDKEIWGIGVVQTGWEFRTRAGVNRKDGREEAEQPDAPLDFEAMAREVSETGEPSAETPDDEVIVDQFYCKRISPWNFLVDPEGDWVLDGHEYVAYCEMVPLNVIRKDPRLKNVKDLKGSSRGMNSFLEDEYRGKEEQQRPTDVKRVKVYHYYEKRSELYAMFCDEHDKPLLAEKWSWDHGRYPFRVIHAHKLQDVWYDDTPVEMVRSQQEELNVTRTMLRNHLRRFTRKYMCSRGMLDRNAKHQLKSAIDGAIVEHNGGPEAKVIMPIDHAPIPPELYKSDEWAIRDMHFQTGFTEYESNTVGKTRRTAQEVAQIQQQGGTLAMSDAQAFEAFCAEIGEDLLDLMMQYSDKIQSIPIYGDSENIQEWSEFSKDDIQGEYIVDVYIGSTMPKRSYDTQQTYIGLLQGLVPFAQMPDPETGGPLINFKALLKDFLRAFPEIKNIDEILAPTPTPMDAAANPMMAMMQGAMPPGEAVPQGGPPV